jgi:antitoxin MazE
MDAIIKKWGNSLGIRIPSFIAKDLSLRDGTHVEIVGGEDQIIIRPKRNATLKELLEDIDSSNLHNEISTNGPVGDEAW